MAQPYRERESDRIQQRLLYTVLYVAWLYMYAASLLGAMNMEWLSSESFDKCSPGLWYWHQNFIVDLI